MNDRVNVPTPAESAPPPAESHPTTEDRSPRPHREPVKMSRYWMIGFPLALVAAAVAGATVALAGADNILGYTGVSEVPEVIDDPTAPGYTAVVEPTPTAMVAHIGEGADLTAVSVLVGDQDETKGGSVLVLPVDTEVTLPEGVEPQSFSVIFDEAGVGGLAVGVGSLLGFGFTEGSSVLDAKGLERMLNAVAPLEINVVDPVTTVDGTLIESGVQMFEADELVAYFELLADGEAPLNRTDRQRQVLDALFAELAANPDALGSVDASFETAGDMFAELASGPVEDISVPVTPEFFEDGQFRAFVISADDADQIASVSASIVPLPIAPYPGARARLELSDGAGDAAARDAAIPVLTAAGAELVLLRNELAFDQQSSEVVYYDESFAEIASDMAAAIGAADPTLLQSEGPLFDVEITLGMDWEP